MISLNLSGLKWGRTTEQNRILWLLLEELEESCADLCLILFPFPHFHFIYHWWCITLWISLDVEGAFDAIPHSVLFHKASDALSDHSWLVLYRWYSCMSVRIKWGSQFGTPIRVEHGIRQGGLSFRLLLIVFFKGLINSLNGWTCGITINRHSYNTLCYADDILLASLTPCSE